MLFRSIDQLFPDEPAIPAVLPSITTNVHTVGSVGVSDLDRVVSGLSTKKAPGPDHITNNMIRHAYPRIRHVLVRLYSKCLEFCYFPRRWRRAVVAVLPKPGRSDYTQYNSYRPISLLCGFGKILERLINDHILSCLSVNPHYSGKQFGFTRGKSTISALDEITGTAVKHKQTHHTCILAVDIKAAFDTASWAHIIHYLHTLNVPSHLIRTVESYLSDRYVTSHYNSSTVTKKLSQGCPQGSCISPLLWNVLLNDLLTCFRIPNTQIFAFADDITAVLWAVDAQSLHTLVHDTLTFIHDWCTRNRLTISIAKTQILNLDKSPLPPVFFRGQEVEQPEGIKILGVTIQDSFYRARLKFTRHIESVVNKIQRVKNALFSLCHNTWGMNSKMRVTLCRACIRPAITYACQIWLDDLTLVDKRRLVGLQRSILVRGVRGYRSLSTPSVNILTDTPPLIPYMRTLQMRFRVRHNKPITDTELLGLIPRRGRFDELFGNHACPTNIRIEPRLAQSTVPDLHIHTAVYIGHDRSFGCFSVTKADREIASEKYKFYDFTGTRLITQFLVRKALTILDSLTDHLLNPVVVAAHCIQINCFGVGGTHSFINKNTRRVFDVLVENPQVSLVITRTLTNNRHTRRVARQAEPTEADRFTRCSYRYYDLSYIDELGREYLSSKLDAEHNKTSLCFREFFPDRYVYPYIKHSFETTQFLTGHGTFGKYLKHRKIALDDICTCDHNTPQDVNHILLHCPLYTPIRDRIYTNTTFDDLNDFINTKDKFRCFVKLTKEILPFLRAQHTYH